MNITIQERTFSLRSEYDISLPGTAWSAQKAFFSVGDKVQVQDETGGIVARIQGKFSFFRSAHEFELSDGRLYQFQCEKMWKGVFVCEQGEDRYRMYEHKGLKYSIFHGDDQIAAFTKNRVVFGNGHQYEIRMNENADKVIVVCLVLTVNTTEDDDDNSTVTIDLGNIGPEDRPFDESWEPS